MIKLQLPAVCSFCKIILRKQKILFCSRQIQLPGIHGKKPVTDRPLLCQSPESGKISLCMAFVGLMGDLNIAVIDHRHGTHNLMDRILILKCPKPFKKLGTQFPVKVVNRSKGKLIAVIHLYDLNLRQQIFLQQTEFLMVFLIQNLISICAIDIITACHGKSEVSGRRKIIDPGKVVDPVRIPGCDLLCPVCRAGIYNNDLIHQILDSIKAPCQMLLFIFYNHTKADRWHIVFLLLVDSSPSFFYDRKEDNQFSIA